MHLLKPLTVDAVLRALLYEISRSSRRIRRARILSSIAYAAHTTGNIERLRTAIEGLAKTADSPGYRALTTYYRSRLLIATGRIDEGLAAEAEFRLEAAEVTKKDRAHEHVILLRAAFTESSSAMARASEAALRGDDVEAAGWYGQSAEELPFSPLRSAMRAFSEVARVNGGLLPSSAALRASLSRLCADNVFAARSVIDVELVLTGLLMRAVDLYEAAQDSGRDAALVAEVADFLGEFRGGTAVGRPQRRDAYGNDALADLTLVGFLSHTTEPVTPTDLAENFPEHHVVWVNVTGAEVGEHFLTVVTLRPANPVPCVRRTRLSAADGKALAQCLDEESEEAPAEAVRRVSGMFFRDVDPDAVTTRVVVVPDSVTWSMPWNELAPRSARDLVITMSMGAALRARPAPEVVLPRVIGLFDEKELKGSRLEARALEGLSARGCIRFTRVHSLAELRNALDTASYDILTVSVHGTQGDGFEYRMLLPDGPSSPAALLQLGLPPVVILGCCWSAKSTERSDTAAAALSCLVAGASQVVGGLWAIDDELAGELLSGTYDRHLRQGMPLPQALREAHLALPHDRRPGAAGLAFMGRA
ncbi:CHAT domain-containing protein [Streptomyces sp. TG1A-60]|uniref:CHAT domain-containing protein n=1 Tax=Streptomyces sp. TG1A-60 TaxID=3129111 RepID=UPI0030D56124